MGIRETQLMGLNQRAYEKLLGLYPVESGVTYGGMFPEEEYPLHLYVKPSYRAEDLLKEIESLEEKVRDLHILLDMELKTCETVYESYEQEVVWSSGPMIYLGLKDAAGNA